MEPGEGRIADIVSETSPDGEPNILIRIERKFIERVLKSHPEKQLRFYRNLAKEVAGKLDTTNRTISEIKKNPVCAKLFQKLLERSAKKTLSKQESHGDIWKHLGNGEVFRDMHPEVLGRIIIGNHEQRPKFIFLQQKESLISEENPRYDSLFIVLSGCLDIFHAHERVGIIGPLGVVGEIAFLNPELGRIAHVRGIDEPDPSGK